MIIKEKQLLDQFSDKTQNYKPILLYGPNEGLTRSNFVMIRDLFKNRNSEQISFTGKSIHDEPELFIDEIKTISMFNDEKIIIIEQPIDKNIDLFENTFQKLPNKILVIIIANKLMKSSKIRNFFDKSNDYLSCANYDDDLKTNSQLINELEKKIKRPFDREIKNYLNKNLSTDRMISNNEIDKIILFYSENNEIPNIEKISLILNDNTNLGLNTLPQIVLSGNSQKVSRFLNKTFAEGTSPISIIRTILNYVQRIEATQIALKKMNNFDDAIKGLKPPVFWKDKDIFQLHCRKWPIQETINNFNILVNAELECKSDYTLTNVLCERALLKIAHKGKTYFQ